MKRLALLSFLIVHAALAGNSVWTATGPTSAQTAIAVDPFDRNIIFAASKGILWQSVDAALTWTAVTLPDQPGNFGVARPYVDGVTIGSSNPRRVVAWGFGGMHESVDGGLTWRFRPIQDVGTVFDIALAGDNRTMYASAFLSCFFSCGSPGVLRSTNGGGTWQSAGFGKQGDALAVRLAVDPTNANVVYALMKTFSTGLPEIGIQKTVDGGRRWANIGPSMPVEWIAVDPIVSTNLFAGNRHSNPFSDSFAMSGDGGRTWLTHGAALGTAVSVAFDPTNHRIVYASLAIVLAGQEIPPRSVLYGVVRSTDGGETWSRISDDNGPTGDLVVGAAGDRLYMTGSEGLYHFSFVPPRRRGVAH